MLDPRNDRLEFQELFAPEESCCLDFAIGTSYSCDLSALIGACLTFGLLADPDDLTKGNPVACLRAIRAATSRLALFCQAGQILRAPKATPLHSLLEDSVFQVCLPKKGRFWPSFHPKVWLARYQKRKQKGEKIAPYYYRLIVQSRNLTFDQSWDISCAFTGKPGKRSGGNKPLIDFFSFLVHQKSCSGSPRQEKMRLMIKELAKIEFQADLPQFNGLEFIPMGIPGHKNPMIKEPLLDGYPHGAGNACDELLIVSPFLGKKTLQYFCDKKAGGEKILITRASSLAKVRDLPLDKFRIYALRDDLAESESLEAAGREIHAKIYFQRTGNKARLWLGSMNATNNAVSENVEFMCCLHSQKLKLDSLLNELFLRDQKNLLNPFLELSRLDLASLREGVDELDESILRELATSDPSVSIFKEGGAYRPELSFGKISALENGYGLTLAPLLCEEWLPLARLMKFAPVPLVKLSAFYRVRLTDGKRSCERILKIPTKGLPREREGEIVRSILNNRQALYNYLSFLLGDSAVKTMWEISESERHGAVSKGGRASFHKLYEKMLRAAHERPEKFDEIEALAKTMGNKNLPEDFASLLKLFKKAIKNKR